jgi:polar amino acid transport system permease protein
MSRWSTVRVLCGFVVEFFRGSSAIVQLFFAFFVLPLAGINLTPFEVAVLILGFNEASYASEIVRGALVAIPKAQLDAASVLGLHGFHRFRRIILPQALPVIVPPFGNAAIEFLKFTTFVSLITVSDLTFRSQLILDNTFRPAPVYTFLLVAYYLMTLVISGCTKALEARVRYAGSPRPFRSNGSTGFR